MASAEARLIHRPKRLLVTREAPAPTIDARGDTVAPDVRALTAAIGAGDECAFDALYHAYHSRLVAHARSILADHADAEDAAHDTFVKAIHALPPLESERALAAWLKTTCTRCCADLIRERVRRRSRERRAAPPEGDEETNPRDLDAALARIRELLSEHDRALHDLITARHRFGWTLHRIARAFALTPSAADGRIRRAIAALRTRAEQEGWTDDE
jgi:RNA polymerase sigma-70 factor, ECF subfamily